MTKLPLVTNSRLRAYRRCPRYHDISYVQGYRPVETSAAMYFGTLVHLGLEGWWGSGLPFALSKMRAVESDEWELIKAEELVRGYDFRWRDENWETVAVEQEFRVPLSDIADMGGKIDAIARRNGQIYIIEHKTSGEDISPGSAYWQRLTLDSQISTYLRAVPDAVGVLYDVLLRPTINPYKATPEASRKYTQARKLYANQRANDETPDEYRTRLREDIAAAPNKYYQRGTVVRTAEETAEALLDCQEWAKRALDGGHAPKNPENCKMYGSVCSYLPVCCGTATLDDKLKYRKVETVNEELNQ